MPQYIICQHDEPVDVGFIQHSAARHIKEDAPSPMSCGYVFFIFEKRNQY